jgi:hypothetical protein
MSVCLSDPFESFMTLSGHREIPDSSFLLRFHSSCSLFLAFFRSHLRPIMLHLSFTAAAFGIVFLLARPSKAILGGEFDDKDSRSIRIMVLSWWMMSNSPMYVHSQTDNFSTHTRHKQNCITYYLSAFVCLFFDFYPTKRQAYSVLCSGVLIDKRVFLTAGQCIEALFPVGVVPLVDAEGCPIERYRNPIPP